MCCHDGEILLDISRSGRERPWKTHKTNSGILSDAYYRLADKFPSSKWEDRGEKVEGCGSSLKFNVCPHGHEKRLKWANFCRIRLCPMCSWRRSLVNAHNLKRVAHEAVKRQKMRWLFLTLTVKNCTSDDLDETIAHMMKSWDRFSRRKRFKDMAVGWFRAFEITRNNYDDTYHPHFHVLIGVKPSYFSHSRNDYISTEEWVHLWRKALQSDYDPIVDIRIVKKKRNVEKELKILEEKGVEISDDGSLIETELSGSAIAELSKYATKSSDYLVYNKYRQKQKGEKVVLIPDLSKGIDEDKTDEVVMTLDLSLSRRRLIAFGGLLKEVWLELEKEGVVQDADNEDTDLVHVEEDTQCKCSVCQSDMLEELYSWLPNVKNYIKKEKE